MMTGSVLWTVVGLVVAVAVGVWAFREGRVVGTGEDNTVTVSSRRWVDYVAPVLIGVIVFAALSVLCTLRVGGDHEVEDVSLGCLPGTSGDSCPVAAVDEDGTTVFAMDGNRVFIKSPGESDDVVTIDTAGGGTVSGVKDTTTPASFYGVPSVGHQTVSYRLKVPEGRVSHTWLADRFADHEGE